MQKGNVKFDRKSYREHIKIIKAQAKIDGKKETWNKIEKAYYYHSEDLFGKELAKIKKQELKGGQDGN